ncbi:MAG TPA: hypothetical protein PKC25_00095 [Candidatus Rifleibacterium sp.]|nr:hypothetical protein [Candidatus Rifleibacterium sp.]
MSSFNRKSWLCLILLAFVFSLTGSTLLAVTKHQIFELSQQIKQKQSQVNKLYAELRKLNEEGGPEAQEKAQVIMAEIVELKEQIGELQRNLEQLKKTAMPNETLMRRTAKR